MARSFSQDAPVVLVVEDEPFIRMDIASFLEDTGLTVLQATNADHAIAILESRNDIRIVFTDIQMPGSMDGLRLAACVRDRWPPIHLIVTSGHGQVAHADLPSGGRFFGKPYEGGQIVKAMTEMLQAR
jgi:CheY-like chemotaxis protein